MRRGLTTKKSPATANKVPHSVIEAVVRETLCAKNPASKQEKNDRVDSSDLEDNGTATVGQQGSRINNKAIPAQNDDIYMPEPGSEFKETARLRRALQASSARERVLVRENASLQVRCKAAAH